MKIREQEENLFSEWRRIWQEQNDPLRKIFIPDGVVNEKAYAASKQKILFVLKEVNGSDDDRGWDLREFLLQEGGRTQTWGTVTRWIEGINLLPEDTEWEKLIEIDQERRVKAVRSIAAINMKKSPGVNTANNRELFKASMEDKELIKRQISIYSPDITICCGTAWLYDYILCDSQLRWNQTSRGIKYSQQEKGKYILDYVHPAARVPEQLKFYGIIDAIREIIF